MQKTVAFVKCPKYLTIEFGFNVTDIILMHGMQSHSMRCAKDSIEKSEEIRLLCTIEHHTLRLSTSVSKSARCAFKLAPQDLPSWPQVRPSWPQLRPSWLPRASKFAPRESLLAPRAPKLAPSAPKLAPSATKLAPSASKLTPSASKWRSKRVQVALRGGSLGRKSEFY